jgi:hypothetical protein
VALGNDHQRLAGPEIPEDQRRLNRVGWSR